MTEIRKVHPNHPAKMKHEDHKRLWNAVEGAVVSALHAHPDYLTDKGKLYAVQSITKRVVGHLISLHDGAR